MTNSEPRRLRLVMLVDLDEEGYEAYRREHPGTADVDYPEVLRAEAEALWQGEGLARSVELVELRPAAGRD